MVRSLIACLVAPLWLGCAHVNETPPARPAPPPVKLSDALSIPEVFARVEAGTLAPSDEELVVRGYLWSTPVKCPPCPAGAACSACPETPYAFGSRPRRDPSEQAQEPLLAVCFGLPGARLNAQDAFLLRGNLHLSLEQPGQVCLDARRLYQDGKEVWRLGPR